MTQRDSPPIIVGQTTRQEWLPCPALRKHAPSFAEGRRGDFANLDRSSQNSVHQDGNLKERSR